MANKKKKKVYANKLEQLQDELATAEQALHDAQTKYQAKKTAVTEEIARRRTNRLCTRGGHLEKYLEEPELFTDAQICKLIDYLFTFDRVKILVADMLKVGHGEVAGSVENLIEAASESLNRVQSGNKPTVTP